MANRLRYPSGLSMETRNRLLDLLPARTQESLRAHLQITHLRFGRVLIEPTDALRHVYFPSTSVLSFVAVAASGNTVEAATADRHGCSASSIDPGESPHRVLVQIAGSAYRVSADVLRRELQHSELFRSAMSNAASDILAQCTQSIVCLAFHPLISRLARWLSRARARTQSNGLEFTHEFIGQMLGATRPKVSQALIDLEARSLIHQGVGRIHVVDRRGLQSLTCDCWRSHQTTSTVEPVVTRH